MTAERVAENFVDAGMLAAEVGVLPEAARSLAERLVAEGHGDALAEITAAFWSANVARLAHRDRWRAYGAARATFDPSHREPPPPPTKPVEPPPPPPDDPPPPPSDRTAL